ncbi:SRPBCC family protein [Nocardioides alcanivorans]|uniref:SRPBCC family protein n=1 Tax=Nocardioides alcanivorans TaxID=2897352 RepID=UPI001F370CDF|nr:SRPBCC family protein [Nocardioides alcanivorans]
MGFPVSVVFETSPEQAFDHLTDPGLRARWQSSLRTVVPVTPDQDGVGARWYDVTRLGIRPLMEVTAWERPVRWTERGTWRGVEVTLSLEFAALPADEGAQRTLVTATADSTSRIGRLLLDGIGAHVAAADLRRAARDLL